MSILKVNTIQDKGGNTLLVSDGAGTISSNNIGIGEADSWRVTTSFANAANGTSERVTSNWERCDTSFEKIGTGLSESSGVFTFPSTGIYIINAIASYYPGGANSGVELQIRLTTDNSSYNTRAIALSGAAGVDRPEAISCELITNVTDLTNQKFSIYTVGTTYSNFWRAASDRQQFGFTCIKLGA
jgi:hypothetical protein